MTSFNTKISPYNPPKAVSFDWEGWRAGLNTLLRPTELKPNELAQADNLWLIGSGIPTKRPGTANYFMANATGSVQMVKGAYFKSGTNELLAIAGGIGTKKSNASYSVIGGASFSSGSSALAHGVMLQDSVYIVDGLDKITKYSGASLIRFRPLSVVSITGATFVSGVSINPGRPYSYRITSLSPIGETLGSAVMSLPTGPQDPKTTTTRIVWTNISAASGDLLGYQIYGRDRGNETFLTRITADPNMAAGVTLTWEDNGTLTPSAITEIPTIDTSDGPIVKYIDKLKDKLILAGLSAEPSRLMWSGGGANVERFHWSYGGGYVDISKDDGDKITGIKAFGGTTDRIIVFKERSIWQVTLTVSGSIVVPTLTLITNSQGAISHRAIVAVENDLIFLSRKGVYVIGNEPNIIGDILRTNELSAKIRPTVEAFNFAQLQGAAATYWNYKYILTYPDSGASANTKMLVYDRERLAWMGPWNIGAAGFEVYYDSTNTERLLYGDTTDSFVTEVSTAYLDDKATTITTFLRTKKEDFKNWSLFKTISDVFFYFRNVLGSVSVNIRLEGKTGETTTAASFTVTSATGSAGWGTDEFGTTEFGLSENVAGSALNDTIKQSHLVKTARAIQIEVQTSNRNDAYELISVRSDAKPQSPGARPSSWRS